MNDSKFNKLILKSSYVVIIVLIIVIIGLLILKYDVEGEKNMPFKLSSIIIISSAEDIKKKKIQITNGMRKFINIMIYI